MSRCWFVIHTHPHGEQKALRNVLQQGFEAYLPCYRAERRHARKTEAVEKPLFPRYFFVRFDPLQDQWRRLLSTFGVANLVRTGDRPMSVADLVVDEIRSREESDGFINLPTTRFKIGQTVRMASGPLSDLVAQVLALPDSERVTLLLSLLGRDVRVTTRMEQVTA